MDVLYRIAGSTPQPVPSLASLVDAKAVLVVVLVAVLATVVRVAEE